MPWQRGPRLCRRSPRHRPASSRQSADGAGGVQRRGCNLGHTRRAGSSQQTAGPPVKVSRPPHPSAVQLRRPYGVGVGVGVGGTSAGVTADTPPTRGGSVGDDVAAPSRSTTATATIRMAPIPRRTALAAVIGHPPRYARRPIQATRSASIVRSTVITALRRGSRRTWCAAPWWSPPSSPIHWRLPHGSLRVIGLQASDCRFPLQVFSPRACFRKSAMGVCDAPAPPPGELARSCVSLSSHFGDPPGSRMG
jgi:hypothetical protein